jgi:hypothetical protein
VGGLGGTTGSARLRGIWSAGGRVWVVITVRLSCRLRSIGEEIPEEKEDTWTDHTKTNRREGGREGGEGAGREVRDGLKTRTLVHISPPY